MGWMRRTRRAFMEPPEHSPTADGTTIATCVPSPLGTASWQWHSTISPSGTESRKLRGCSIRHGPSQSWATIEASDTGGFCRGGCAATATMDMGTKPGTRTVAEPTSGPHELRRS